MADALPLPPQAVDVRRRARSATPVLDLVRRVPMLYPVAFLVGTNVKILDAGSRPVYVGMSELAVLVGLAVAVVALVRAETRLRLPIAATAALLAFSALVVLSNVLNVVGGRWADWPVPTLLEIVRWFEYLSVVPAIAVLVQRPSQIRAVLLVGMLCLLANSGVGLYQAATFDFAEMRTYALFRSAADAEGLSESNPNTAGTLFMYGALLMFAYVPTTRRRWARWGLAVGAGACVVSMLFTLSRSSMLGFFGGLALLPFLLRLSLRGRIFAGLGLVLFGGAAGVLVALTESLATRIANTVDLGGTSSDAASVMERFENWRITLAVWPEYVWTGLGYGRFGQFFPFITPDNLYLEVLASTGIVGLLLFCAWLSLCGVEGLRARVVDPTLVPLRAAYVSIVAGTALASVAGSVLLSPRVCGTFFLLSGLVFKLGEWGAAAPPERPR